MSIYYSAGSIAAKRAEKILNPYTVRTKRITVLLSKCQSFQSSLVGTVKTINKSASDNQKFLKSIRQRVNQEPENIQFQENFQLMKLRKKNEKTQISEIQQKISSMLKKSKNDEKFPLKRTKSKIVQDKIENEFIELNEITSPEAQEILKSNKRKFGEQLRKGESQMILGVKSKAIKYHPGSKRAFLSSKLVSPADSAKKKQSSLHLKSVHH